jgi:hypothetical protein
VTLIGAAAAQQNIDLIPVIAHEQIGDYRTPFLTGQYIPRPHDWWADYIQHMGKYIYFELTQKGGEFIGRGKL